MLSFRCIILVCTLLATRSKAFLLRRGSVIYGENGKPFRAAGANVYWLGLDNNENGLHYPTKFRITDALDTMAGWLGTGSIIRSHTLGISTGCSLSFEPKLDVFNHSALDAADWAISEAERLGLRLIIPLTDNGAHYAGGKSDFTSWNGIKDENQFYYNSQVVGAFQRYISARLQHVNPYTGRKAIDEPSIAIWETGNELSGPANWTDSISKFIKNIDENHLVMDGTYGIELDHLNLTDVDVYTDHFYPPSRSRLLKGLTMVHAANKVYSLGEFGWTANPNGGEMDEMLQTCLSHSVCLQAAPWSFFPHADTHGYVQHGDGFTFHFPGWESKAAMHLIQFMHNYSAAMKQRNVTPFQAPTSKPMITLAKTVKTTTSIAWRGTAMASVYEIQQALSKNGPWITLPNGSMKNNITDNDTPWNVSSLATGSWVRVRGIGYEDKVATGPWSVPVKVDLGKMQEMGT
jgi:mannan endo-1,4-beta-mannosidase